MENITDGGTDVALGDNCCWIDCRVLCESFFGKKKEEKCCLMRLKQ